MYLMGSPEQVYLLKCVCGGGGREGRLLRHGLLHTGIRVGREGGGVYRVPCGGTSSSHSLPPGRHPAKSVVSPMATPAHRSGCRTTHMHCERGKGEGRG